MPVKFWNDPDGAKYRAAYFEQYPGVWRHGDWMEITPHGGAIIYGRSDAVLNPAGCVSALPRSIARSSSSRKWKNPSWSPRTGRAMCASCSS
jgi:hypothetical protein